MKPFAEYDIVEVLRVVRPPEAYDDWHVGAAPPSVCARGTIVHLFERDGEWWYTVEGPMANDRPTWMGDFAHSELRPTGMRHNLPMQWTGAASKRSWIQRFFGRGTGH